MFSFCNVAEAEISVISPEFRVSGMLRDRVEFWKLIFTKYGPNHLVFHHRSYPEIIYSVLDFSEYEKKLSFREFGRKKNQAVKQEIESIRQALNRLGRGEAASSELERRIEKLFSKRQYSSARQLRRAYLAAANVEQVRYQTGISERFRQGIERSGLYLHAIEEVFRTAGLPLELSRLPLVESSFDYKAYSSVGAAGIWQFTRSTGKQYLNVGPHLDERRDPILASRAAAKYLKNAYNNVGSWPLAVTSYNHGLGGVIRAVRQTGSKDLELIIKNYQSPSFGFASSNFYAEFVAALEVEREWRRYFPGLVREKPLFFDEIRIERPVSLGRLSQCSGASKDRLSALNLGLQKPILNGQVTIPANYVAKVERGKGQRTVAALGCGEVLSLTEETSNYLSKGRKSKQAATAVVAMATSTSASKYKVRPGDTLGAIARRMSVRQADLMRVNNIRDARKLRAGILLAIPAKAKAVTEVAPVRLASASKGSSVAETSVANSAGANAGKKYVVKKGDNLSIIARKLGTSVKNLQRNNPSIGKLLYPGQSLAVP
ncbi:MAG: transglycosylase SLT domain-containing protein [Deltaproteobacteria bacterium]|nr:transglycosylase SLT domain-containing protein [Deltaproteobacteria bacterium]